MEIILFLGIVWLLLEMADLISFVVLANDEERDQLVHTRLPGNAVITLIKLRF